MNNTHQKIKQEVTNASNESFAKETLPKTVTPTTVFASNSYVLYFPSFRSRTCLGLHRLCPPEARFPLKVEFS